MGIKKFFKGLWNGIKKGASKIWNGVKKVIGFGGRLVKPVLQAAPQVLTGLAALPGKAGMIGKIGAPIAGVLNGIINKMPDGAAKDKVQEVYNKGQNFVNQANDKVMNVAQNVSNTAQKWLPVANEISNIAGNFKPKLAVI